MKNVIIYLPVFGRSREIWIQQQIACLKQYNAIICCLKHERKLLINNNIYSLKARNTFIYRIRQLNCAILTYKWPKSHIVYSYLMSRHVKYSGASLIHNHFLWNSSICIQAGKLSNIPVISTAHGTDVNTAIYNEHFRKKLIDIVFPQINCIIAVSQNIQQKLIDIGCPQEKVTKLYIGVPIPKNNLQFRSYDDVIQIVCVAAFVKIKGHIDLIRAFSKAAQYVNIRMTLVGDGSEHDNIKQLISQLNLNHLIHITGWKEPSQVQMYLQQSDIYAQASYKHINNKYGKSYEEALGISYVEAASNSLPIVSTNCGGISEICRDGINGYLVPEHDIDSISNAIVKLSSNKKLRKQMGQKSKEIAQNEFDIKKQTNKLEELYHRVVTKHANHIYTV